MEYTKAWVLNWNKVAEASWFEIPKLMPVKPVFDLRAILPVLIMFIVTAVETVGDISGVMEGGLGLMPDLRRLLGKLHSMQSVQTIVITGKNHKMYEEWVNRYEDVKVLGYTENISKYMRWADLVITKAGGITLFEILHSQVPLFVIHPFLEQEMNNARYAAEKGFAKVVWGKHEDYISELEKLLNDRKLLKQMDENVRHARKEMIDVSLDKAVEIMGERMTA